MKRTIRVDVDKIKDIIENEIRESVEFSDSVHIEDMQFVREGQEDTLAHVDFVELDVNIPMTAKEKKAQLEELKKFCSDENQFHDTGTEYSIVTIEDAENLLGYIENYEHVDLDLATQFEAWRDVLSDFRGSAVLESCEYTDDGVPFEGDSGKRKFRFVGKQTQYLEAEICASSIEEARIIADGMSAADMNEIGELEWDDVSLEEEDERCDNE